MRKSKFISLILCVVMIVSTASVAFAAPVPVPASENPTVYVEIGTVTAAGKAAVDLYISVDTTFRPYTAVEDEETLEMVYNGKGIRGVQIEYFLNENYFDKSSAGSFTGYNSIAGKQLADGSIQWLNSAVNEAAWMTSDTTFRALRVTANIVDEDVLAALGDGSTTEQKNAAKDMLNAKTDLISYKTTNITIAEFPVAGAAAAGMANWQYNTQYRSDGLGDFKPILKTGAEPKPTVSANDIPEDQPAKRTWTVKVPAELMNGDFYVQLINTTKNETTADNKLAYAQGVAYSGTGEATFNVWTMIKNAANNSDNLQLKFTANGQSATN